MATVEARRISKYFDDVHAVDGIDLIAKEGEFLVLLGPSGCGKTTLMRMIAGLEQPTSGDIVIDGNVVTDLPPRARNVAMVFQSYALYPHLTVEKNISFPLRAIGHAEERDPQEGRVGGEHVRHRALPRPQATPALRRRTPARGARPRGGARAGGVSARRAAVEPRCQAAQFRARRAQAVSAQPRHDDDLRHPRPGRGHGARRPYRRAQPGQGHARSARRRRSTATRWTPSSPPSSARRR